MARDLLNESSVEAQTWRTSTLIVGILAGGVLLVTSLAARWVFAGETGTRGPNPYSGMLSLAAAVLLGLPLLVEAVKNLFRGRANMDELVALSFVAALAGLDYQAAAAVAFFLLLANLIETRTALGARASIESLLRLSPKKAHRLVGDEQQEQLVDPLELAAGDLIRVRPGDNVPADGDVVSGQTSINQATITGESLPVDKSVGDEVFSGTTNLSGAIDVRVTRAGEDTTLGHVRRLILQAEATRSPMMRLIDQYAGWYTPTIVMFAAIVFALARSWGWDDPWGRVVAMMVVACPAALIIAVPTAMVASLSCAARLGVFIKDVRTIETAQKLSAFVFDKTGTLTTGELSVTRMMPLEGVEGADLLAAAASVETLSKHPVALAVMAVARRARVAVQAASGFEEVPGRGVKGTVGGRAILVGRRTWLTEQGVDFSIFDTERYAEPEGLSTLYVVRDGKPLGWIGMEDRTREEAREAMDQLRDLKIRELVMVTGDRWSVARRVGREMGCTEVQAEVLPADKLDLVAALQARGHVVAVVGDGVNDAPALAAGDLSIAMGAAGSDVAIKSANIALMNNDLRRLSFLVRLSRRTTRVIHQNLMFGVFFIVVMEILAIWGVLPPVWGALMQMVGAMVVMFNSARLVRFGEEMHVEAPEEPSAPVLKTQAVGA